MAIRENVAALSAAPVSPGGDLAAAAVPDAPGPRPGTVKLRLAAETLRLYAGDWTCFEKFSAERGQKPLPAASTLVAAFLATANVGKTALSRRLAAIDHQHRKLGLPAPGADPALRTGLRQARRQAPRPARPPAATPAALQRMAESCRADLVGQRDRALLLLLAAGLGRAAIVAIAAEQLRFSEPGVTLGRVDPDGAQVQIARSPTRAGCPVRALEDFLHSAGTRYGPVFRKINRWGQLEHQALGADAIRLILARRSDAGRPARVR